MSTQSNPLNAASQAPPTDPSKNFLGFVMENKEAIGRMPEDKQLRFIDMLFRRFLLPKYQAINKQKPLDQDEIDGLRDQFAARLLGIPIDNKTTLKDPEIKHGVGAKVAAGVESAGAGVLGGIRTFSELVAKFDKSDLSKDPIHKAISRAEGKAYSDAQAISPGVASTGAAVGHQIPAAMAAEGAGSLFPKVAKGANIAAKAGVGAAKGAAEGTAYESAHPGGDPKQGAMWGGVLGAAFPFLGKLFGLGRGTTTKAAEAVGAGEKAAPAAGAASEATSLGDVANKVAKEKFGKAFKDLSPTEKAQMPSIMKEEIKKQAAVKAAQKKANVAAAKAGREAEETAKRAEKAKAASEKAAAQAEKRSQTGSTPSKATAAKAAEENPAAAKHAAVPTESESEMERIRRNPPMPVQEMSEEAKKAAEVKPTKVPEGQSGPKVRAKEGKPASPAQQAADRERIAAKRELSKKEEFGAALEKHAQEMAGRYTASSVGIMHLPELEEAVKEMPNGDYMLKTLQKARRAYKWSDEIYTEYVKEWLMKQFEKEAK